ncbi:TolC family protein [Sulfurimonas sp. HSL1-6]|uniref:TolC family protein n=1 Tax=Thiomicrolovo immobilis TaxID=3131935 RepID=UPI0031F9FB8C
MRGLHAFAALWLLSSGLCAVEQNATVLFGTQQRSGADRQSVSLEAYLSELKRKAFGYDYAKTEEESAKLRDSWIQPALINYTLTRQNPYNERGAPETQQESASIAIDQPIFRSGGIYYGIKYAQASRDVGMLTIAQQERTLIKQAVDLLMQIKQSELGIAKQKLQVDNTEINLLQKREQYMSGQLDSGFLNNAIIERNLAKQALLDLQTAQAKLVSAFESISDLDYREAKIPFLASVDEARFMDGTIDLALARQQRAQEGYNKAVTLASYLPSISLQGSYNWQKRESIIYINGSYVQSNPSETSYYSYGLKASMPIDVNSINDYEASRLAYLKSKVTIDDTKRALRSLYEQVVENLRNIDAKIALSRENEALYATLLHDTQEQYGVGLKTQYDVDLLANSRQIEKLSQRSYEIDRQRELLNLYEKLSDPES